MGYYVVEIWGADQPPHFSDFYAPWWAAHELLLHGRNPYSPQVAHEIQNVIYGAPSTPTSPDDPQGIGGGFAYPPYAALLLWPTVHLSFSAAQRAFLLASVLLTLFSAALWLRILGVHPSSLKWIAVVIFVLGSFPVLQALQLENLSLIASALITITVVLVLKNHLVLAGIFLAVATFKPQFTIVLIPWIVLWTLGDWRRRSILARSFLGTLFLLFAVSEWLVPGWIRNFLEIIRAYRHYTYGHSLLDVWFTPSWGPMAGGAIVVAVLILCGRERAQVADSPRFVPVTSLVLAATVLVIPTLAPHAQLLLLPGVLCLLCNRSLLLSSGTPEQLVLTAIWSLLAWPWIATFGLLLVSTRYPTPKLLGYWELPLYTSPLLPLAVLVGLVCLLFSNGMLPTGSQTAKNVAILGCSRMSPIGRESALSGLSGMATRR
jgi:hypothetical protein